LALPIIDELHIGATQLEGSMAGILDVLKQAGALPLAELRLRSSLPDAEIDRHIQELLEKGLVTVGSDGQSSRVKAASASRQDVVPSFSGEETISLTDKALRAALRGSLG
jgi:DNA-binding transcriptional ArsR family regulator